MIYFTHKYLSILFYVFCLIQALPIAASPEQEDQLKILKASFVDQRGKQKAQREEESEHKTLGLHHGSASSSSPESIDISKDETQLLQELSQEIDYTFKKPELLHLALRHSTTDIGHSHSSRGYERLEFLGDAVLEHVIREFLWKAFPKLNANELSKICSTLTCNETLAHLSKHLRLAAISKRLKLSTFTREETLQSHRQADFVESLIGAIYSDGGIEASHKFFKRYYTSERAPTFISNIMNSISQEAIEESPLSALFSNNLYKRAFYEFSQFEGFQFVGEGILRFILRDMLYYRFPESTEGELVQKYNSLISAESLSAIVTQYNLNPHLSKHSLKSFLGLLYLDKGLESVQNFILWHWTGGEAPKAVVGALEKRMDSVPSLDSSYFVSLPARTQIQFTPKNILQEVLQMLRDEPYYSHEKTGPDHNPTFTVTVQSKLEHFKSLQGQAGRLLDAQQEAAQKVLDILSVKALLATIGNKEDAFKNVGYSLKLLEAKLRSLGIREFSYHKIAKSPYLKNNIYRFELQGKNVYPTFGEDETIEAALLQALSKGILRLCEAEYKKATHIVKGTHQDIPLEENRLIFLKSILEETLKPLGYENFTYVPYSKSKEKIQPYLVYEIQAGSLRSAKGQGLTPLQAQINALEALLDSMV